MLFSKLRTLRLKILLSIMFIDAIDSSPSYAITMLKEVWHMDYNHVKLWHESLKVAKHD